MDDPYSPSRPPACSPDPLTVEQATLRHLSERFVTLHRGLRVLEAVGWSDATEADFFAHGCQKLPAIERDSYACPLAFDPATRRAELRTLERDTRRLLGATHPGAQLLLRRCREARQVIDLLEARGTPQFGPLSERLYGTPPADNGLAAQLHRLANRLGEVAHGVEEPASVDALTVVAHLQERLTAFFGNARLVRVRAADDLAANAAATLDTIKVRRDARFTPREVRLLEVHEGWVHLGTTLNGQSQPVCTFLSKCLPSATTTQEGLAVLVEVLAGASHARRLDRLALRVEGITWARAGANFREVFDTFCERGLERHEAYKQAMRIFRGTLPTGGTAFAKDACYARGFVALARWLSGGDAQASDDLTLLTVGKTRREDVPLLRALRERGLLRAPRFVPPVLTRSGVPCAPRTDVLTSPPAVARFLS